MSAPKKTRAAVIAIAKEQAELQARIDQLNDEVPKFGSGTHELLSQLETIHRTDKSYDIKEFEECFEESLKYDKIDLLDVHFWESGIEKPADDDDVDKWKNAFELLDIEFAKRALLAHHMKIVYKQLRRAHLDMIASISQSDQLAASKSDQPASSKSVKITDKPCRCRTKCALTCGCKKSGRGCSQACGCGHVECRNPHSYPDDKDGRMEIDRLDEDDTRKGKEALVQKMKNIKL